VTNDRYVASNYAENTWYYGVLGRTAWFDSPFRGKPVAAVNSAAGTLVLHETGVDDNVSGTPVAISSYLISADFDIGDGDKFAFAWRILPDVTFRNSTAANPRIQMELLPMKNAGSGYTNPASTGGNSEQPVVRSTTVPVEQFTGQINIRARGRQMVMEVRSTDLDVQWQLGSPRIDIRPDGRR